MDWSRRRQPIAEGGRHSTRLSGAEQIGLAVRFALVTMRREGRCTRQRETPMDGSWLATWRTVHVIAVVVFLAGHAVSMYAAFRFKSVSTVEQAKGVLELSRKGLLVAYVGLLVTIVAGILAGIAGQWFTSGRWWIWAAIVVLVIVTIVMTNMAAEPMAGIRWQLGATPTRNPKQLEKKLGPAGQGTERLAELQSGWKPIPIAIVGLVGLAFLLWLLSAKPF
jgi:hypothetical protein